MKIETMTSVFNFLVNNPLATTVVNWTGAITVGGFVLKKLNSSLGEIVKETIDFIRVKRDAIRDPELRAAANIAVRWVAKHLPEDSDFEKLQAAIKYVQDITPDWLLSDEKVKIAVEMAWSAFKRELLLLSNEPINA